MKRIEMMFMDYLRLAILILLVTGFTYSVNAQLEIQQTNTPFEIDFDNTTMGVNEGAFTGNGFTSNPGLGQIDSDGIRVSGLTDGDVDFGGTGVTGDFARGVASNDVNTGGIYSFEVNTNNYTLGANPRGGDFRPGSFTLLVINKTNQTVNPTRIEYEFWYYNSENRSTQIEFSYSFDDNNYTTDSELTFSTPQSSNNNPVWQNELFRTTANQVLTPGDSIYLQWTITDNGGTGPSADQFGLNNISVVMEESGLLPVHWVSFDAQKINSTTELIWKTAEEINNDHFEILHSSNAEEWNLVGEVAAKSNLEAVNKYSFVHENPAQGYNYYRIKQVDKDGQYDFSQVCKVHFSQKTVEEELDAYPSPTDNFVYFDNRNLIHWESVRIINDEGKVVRNYGNRIPKKISVKALPEGVYWLTARSGQDTVREKFIVQ